MSKIQLHSLVLIALLAFSIVGAKTLKPAAKAGRVKTDFSLVPLSFNGWKGEEKRFSEDTYSQLSTASLLLRYYEKNAVYESPVELAVVYGMDLGNFHQPEVCLEGQGLHRVDSRSVTVTKADGRSFKAVSVIMDSDYGRRAFVYWFYTQGVYSTSLGNYKLRLFADRLTRSKKVKPSAMVRMSTDVLYSDNEAVERLIDFSKDIAPYLERQISPSEKRTGR
ncbi:MAG: exosortase C-terminal domain/associated protein EpsI [Armatimonadota bacterium]